MRPESERLSHCRPTPRRCGTGHGSALSPMEHDDAFLSQDEMRRGSWRLLHHLNNMSIHEDKALDLAFRRAAYVSKMKEDLDTEIPRLQYHMDSWDKEVTRAGYQTRLAGVFARLYPSGEVYDREAYTTVEHYVRSAEVTKAQRDAIAAEQQEAVAGLEMAKGQLLVLGEERELRLAMKEQMQREAAFCKERYLLSIMPWK